MTSDTKRDEGRTPRNGKDITATGEISEASANTALQEAQGLVLPDIGELETEGATQAFAVPQTPPSMLESQKPDDEVQPSKPED